MRKNEYNRTALILSFFRIFSPMWFDFFAFRAYKNNVCLHFSLFFAYFIKVSPPDFFPGMRAARTQ